ncbi:MAG: C40 family peptidase [Marinobacter sp.]|uniref:C40 family peptidase n=1 Tax=Marinobacter sp. TaxID=50741 RepID=UPI00349FDD91
MSVVIAAWSGTMFKTAACVRKRSLLLMLVVAGLGLGGCASNQSLKGQGHHGYATDIPEHWPSEGDSTLVDELERVFQRYEGSPYRYGGMTADGFDCSGFILTAYREALGQQLPRTTSQMLAAGRAVRLDQIKPGDLVFFRIDGKEQHAGIYMGGIRFIHASSSVGVTESSLSSHYWQNRFTRARRFRE